MWDWSRFDQEIKDLPPTIYEKQRLTISKKVSDTGSFNVTASENFYFKNLLQTILVEEPENKT